MEEKPEGKGTWLDGVSVNQMGRKGSKGVRWVKDLPEGVVVLMKMFAKATEQDATEISIVKLCLVSTTVWHILDKTIVHSQY